MMDQAGSAATDVAEERTEEHDLCRICRSEGSRQDPLYYPCKCSGSIKYVHQDCLKEWLSHSQKKHCELCKTPFRFTKFYSPDMPEKLPTLLFIRRAAVHVYHELVKTCRGLLVFLVWGFWVPWCMRQVFWGLFWIADGGWIQDLNTSQAGIEANVATVTSTAINLPTSLAPQDASPTTLFSFDRLQSRLRLISNIMTLGEHVFNNSETGNLQKNDTVIGRPVQHNDSLLSGLAFFRNLTPNPALNKFVTDVLEGQIIAWSVVLAFILIFLIREWVVQQQPNIPQAEVLPRVALQWQGAEEEQQNEVEDAEIIQPQQVDLDAAGAPDQPQTTATDLEVQIFPLDQSETLGNSTESSSSSGSWQQLADDTHSDGGSPDSSSPSNETNHQPDPATIDNLNTDVPVIIADDRPANENIRPRAREPEMDENMHSIFAPSTEEREAVASATTAAIPTNNEVREDTQASAAVQIPPRAHRTYFGLFWDWLFAEAEIEERVVDLAEPLVRPEGQNRVDPLEPADHALNGPEEVNEGPFPDLEDAAEEAVQQDADDALEDVEAIDDAEELEGALELIGMQGPLAGLFQNAVFSAILISTTITAAVWAPYLWGKIVLLFLAHPYQFAIKMPLVLLTWTCNFIVDVGLYLGCAFLSQVDWLGRLALVPPGWMFPALAGLSEYNAISASIQSVGNLALGRLHGLLMASTELPRSDFYHLSLSSHAALETLRIDSRSAISYTWNVLERLFLQLASFRDSQIALSAMLMTALQLWHHIRNFSHALALHLANISASMHAQGIAANVTASSVDDSSVVAFVKWTAIDRFSAVSAGYLFLAVVGMLYVKAGPPLTSSEQIRKVEMIVAEVLRQAGGVLKVILIISIEMLLFPLYCGFLLDIAVLPLFDATIMSRIQYTISSPWSACFLHWFIGTCYMFHFALFVSMCRKLLRGGVLYFIRDPDDPTFHPVRDVLERNIATQLRKIGFSALVYGLLVICCLGSVVWTTSYVTTGLFPIRWTSSIPRLEFPIDLMLYHTLTPIAIHLLKPATVLEKVYGWWFQKCGHALRLSQFLFGAESDTTTETGRWVRAPSSDQVRIPKGRSVFLVVDKDNNRLDGQPDEEDDKGPHGRANKHFAKVFVPLWFRTRIGLFVLCIWALTATAGLTVTVAPLIFGRLLLGQLVGVNQEINDVHAFSIGMTTLALAGFLVQARMEILEYVRHARTTYNQAMGSLTQRMVKGLKRATAVIYTYTMLTLWIPTILALSLELYFIMPLHTYVQLRHNYHHSRAALQNITAPTTSLLQHQNTIEIAQNATIPASLIQQQLEPTTKAASSSLQNTLGSTYTVHALQSWILGLLYTRILIRLLLTRFPIARPTRALQAVVARGWLNPNARIATKCFIVPLTVVGLIAILAPAGLGLLVNNALSHYSTEPENIDASLLMLLLNLPLSYAKTLTADEITRLAYPAVSVLGLAVYGLFALVKAIGDWRRKIRDEVYLVGERLHNFGEAKPPVEDPRVDKGKRRAVEEIVEGLDELKVTVDASTLR